MLTQKNLIEFLGGLHINGQFKAGKSQVYVTQGVTITLAAGATNSINATFQAVDGKGQNVARVQPLEIFITDEALGAGPLTTESASGALSASSGQILVAFTAKKHVKCMTDATGKVVLNLIDTGKPATIYFHAMLPLTGEAINSVISGTNWG